MNSNAYYLFDVASIVASLGVFIDASRHRVGQYLDDTGVLRGHSPLLWGLLTLIFWVFIFPLYLFRRKKLLDAARNYPVKGNKTRGLFVMIVASIFLMWYVHLR